ncbi:LysR family transcriptional regulator [Ferrimonas lipolytica]|uniref:LysR family transcriptional regulator n=1 Tax=Ferrimonas lipolytica TaxID=2724191 RepID=A0A6H1UBT2_9GAMM|nr:LysR family transcriptional regulator [Ferrimonas lipolytica]QIZ75666.1 LysR family transcriptional regulator [Ferrimonas lipolytica]
MSKQSAYLQLKRIAIFTTVVECGSFVAAAKRLQLSRTKVSENISTLESALGVRLFQRTTRKLTITPEGERFYQQTERMLPDASAALESVKEAGGALEGPLRISLNGHVAQWLLVPFLKQFMELHPKVEPSLQLHDLPVDLIESQIDIAIRIGIPKASSMVGQQLTSIPLGLMASKDYVERFGMPLTLDDLQHHRGVMVEQMLLWGPLLLENEQGQSEELKLPASFKTNSPSAVTMMVEQGLGIGFLPTYAIEERQRLVPILPQWRFSQMTLSVLYPSRHSVPARTRAFIEQFKQWISDNPIKPY